jgi:DNA modification methylase
MERKRMAISEIKSAPYNPRLMKKEEFEKLKRSIETFDCYEPLIVNSQSWHVVGGNQRLRALLELGYSEVEVVIVDLSIEKEKLLNVALNKIHGEFVEDKLAVLIDGLNKISDIDISLSGFDMPEVSQLLDRFRESRDEDEFDVEKEVEAIDAPKTNRGDIVILGPHRILCGDSGNPDDLAILMDGEKADMVDCDFPYNVNYAGGNVPNPNTRPKNSRKWPQIYADNMPQNQYEAWMNRILTNIKEYLKPGGPFYIWQGLRQIPPLCQNLIDLDFHVSCIICWLKESAAITYADYCYRTEQALYGWREGAPHYWAGKPASSNVWEVRRDPTKAYVHPTQKPVQLAQNAIKNSSKVNDIVLDTFLGSASVLIGAESLGRRCYGCEIDPRYVDVAVKRYITYAGEDKVSEDVRKKYLKEA